MKLSAPSEVGLQDARLVMEKLSKMVEDLENSNTVV
jgi:hypothetical protein